MESVFIKTVFALLQGRLSEAYMNDNVNRPNHYVKIVNCKEYECKDTIKIITADSEASEAFFLGNSVKYLWRYKHKNGREDLQKAIKNIELLIENVYGTEGKVE